jgi:polyhydroxyalkanoate synthesis regulator protein
MTQATQPILVKLYGSRRLYDTEPRRYVTTETITELWRDGHAVVGRDARTGEDITSAMLGQPITRKN